MGEGLSAGAGSGAGLCPMLQGEGHETGPPLQGPAALVCVLRCSEPGPVPATCAGGLVPGLPLPSHGGDRGSPHSRGRGFAPKPVSPPGPSAILCFHTWRRQDWTSGFSSSGPAPTRPRGADEGLPQPLQCSGPCASSQLARPQSRLGLLPGTPAGDGRKPGSALSVPMATPPTTGRGHLASTWR